MTWFLQLTMELVYDYGFSGKNWFPFSWINSLGPQPVQPWDWTSWDDTEWWRNNRSHRGNLGSGELWWRCTRLRETAWVYYMQLKEKTFGGGVSVAEKFQTLASGREKLLLTLSVHTVNIRTRGRPCHFYLNEALVSLTWPRSCSGTYSWTGLHWLPTIKFGNVCFLDFCLLFSLLLFPFIS